MSPLNTEAMAPASNAVPPPPDSSPRPEHHANADSSATEAHAPAPYRHEEWRPAGESFKAIPDSKEQRELIRAAAAVAAARLPRTRPPDKQTLYAAATELLKPLGYGPAHVGFAMVLVNNEYWREEFAAVPFEKRLLLLPHCLKQAEHCTAKVDQARLHCNHCGLCAIADFTSLGRRMGYRVLVAEGTPGVLKLITEDQVDAVLGVACLNVLEKAFDKVLQMGLPALAVPLLRDTCHNTAVDEDWVLAALGYQQPRGHGLEGRATTAPRRTHSFVPLLRDVSHYFDPKPLAEILPPERAGAPRGDKVAETERLSLAWLGRGGKRFRPFVTAAAWQAMTDKDEVPLHVKRVAAAMEVFHKASLIHDDIEDDDDFRYGTAALHKSHSVPVALNIGDYLIGRGYRLVMEQASVLGVEGTARIMQRLSHAHVRLCEGQGAELLWRKSGEKSLPPLECLRLYALKTAPAFEAALYAGIVLADGNGKWDRELADFTKHLGVAYQIQNDLKDVTTGAASERATCGDILRGRPTLLFAMALEAANAAEKADILQAAREGQTTTITLERLREIYFKHGIPLLAARLAENQRTRALAAVERIGHDGLHALFTFLAATLLD